MNSNKRGEGCVSLILTVIIFYILYSILVAKPIEHKVEYKVDGVGVSHPVGKVSITYTNATGEDDSIETTLPWSKTIIVKGSQYIRLAATSYEEITSLSCSIRWDGSLWKESLGTWGWFGGPSCSGWGGN